MAKSTIAFIINPNSGTNNKKDLPDLIRKILDADRFDISIEFTKYAGHGKELARQYGELETEIEKLSNYDKIYTNLNEAYQNLTDEVLNLDSLYEAASNLGKIKE